MAYRSCVVAVVGSVLACSGSTETVPAGAGGNAPSATSGSGGAATQSTSSESTTTADHGATTSSATGPSSGLLACFQEPPANAPQPEALISDDGCPAMQAGSNSIDGRKVMLALPKDLQPAEKLPVVFLWHWLGGSAQGFFDKADVQNAVDHYRFAAIAPEAKGDLQFKWPFLSESTPIFGNSQARVDEDLHLFDKSLACLNKSFTVNRHCVSSVGVSAGALWTQVLAQARSEYLASFESLSGGEGGGAVRPFAGAGHKMPAMVLWGGPSDNCLNLFSFDALSKSLSSKVGQQGHFLLECIHNCGHSVPPFEPLPSSPTTFGVMWEFVLDHPYWLPAGTSPWQSTGIPIGFPEWCAMGSATATPRTGACKDGSQC